MCERRRSVYLLFFFFSRNLFPPSAFLDSNFLASSSLCESAGSVIAPWVLGNFVQLFEFDITTTVDTALAALVGINRSIERRWMEEVEGGSFS